MVASWLWIVFTVAAAFFQTLRNAMQRELTTTLGTVGATHVRFLFGFPKIVPAGGWCFWARDHFRSFRRRLRTQLRIVPACLPGRIE